MTIKLNNMKEVWKDIKGYEGLYQVSNLGNIKSFDRKVLYNNGKLHYHKGRMIKKRKKQNGYLSISVCKNGVEIHKSVHRIVAEAFIKNPNNYPQVLHKNNIRNDNMVSNLKWGTQKHNMEQASKSGRMSSGDNHYMRKNPVNMLPSRLTIDLRTGIFYDSIKQAAITRGLSIKEVQDRIWRAKDNIYKDLTYA